MRELCTRLIRRSLFVAVVLGIIGYIFAEMYLMLYRMNGGIPHPENNSIRWRAPLKMMAFGIGFQLVVEIIFSFVRRGLKPEVKQSPDSSGDKNHPLPPSADPV